MYEIIKRGERFNSETILDCSRRIYYVIGTKVFDNKSKLTRKGDSYLKSKNGFFYYIKQY